MRTVLYAIRGVSTGSALVWAFGGQWNLMAGLLIIGWIATQWIQEDMFA